MTDKTRHIFSLLFIGKTPFIMRMRIIAGLLLISSQMKNKYLQFFFSQPCWQDLILVTPPEDLHDEDEQDIDGGGSKSELVQLLVIPDSMLEVTGDDLKLVFLLSRYTPA